MNDAISGSGADTRSGVAAMLHAVVRTRVGGNLLMFLALGGGLMVAWNLDVAIAPKVDSKQVFVTVPYEGSSPNEIEESITRRVEENLIGLSGVRRVTSYASAGVGTVKVSVEPLADTDEVLERVRAAVERIERFPPPEAEGVEVAVPELLRKAATIAVSSQDLSPQALRGAAERVREDLLALPAVANVMLNWTPSREIAIEVSEEALREYGLNVQEVTGRLQRSSIDLTSGHLFTPGGGLVVGVTDRATTVEDFENMVLITQRNGGTVKLKDVANVHERLGEPTSLSEFNGVPAVFVTSMASEDGLPMVDVAREVRSMLASYDPPPGVELTLWEDASQTAVLRLSTVLDIGIMGLALVFVFLALVFDFRLAMWVAVGLPTAFLGALILFPAFDLTLNYVVLFGLVIMIGIVVDDAVVVGESIARERELGREGVDAAVAGAKRVFWPVVVGVATTFVAFTPLLFTYGQFGQFIKPIAIVVGLVLAMSLIEAFFILPSHLAAAGDWSRGRLARVQAGVRKGIDEFRERLALSAIVFATRNPVATVVSAAAMLSAAAVLYATGVVPFVEYEQSPSGNIRATLTYPTGTPLATTAAGARQVAEAARRADDQLEGSPVDGMALIVGHRGGSGPVGGDGTHVAVVDVRLRDETERGVSIHEVGRVWWQEIGEVLGAERVAFSYTDVETLGVVNTGVGFALIHPNEDVLKDATDEFIATIESMPGVMDVMHSRSPGTRHFHLELTPIGRAAGLSAAGLAAQLRGRFFGAEVQRIQRGRDEIKVMVRYPEEERRSFADLLDERVALPLGGSIPLVQAAKVIEHEEFQTLTRIDGVPAVEVDVLLSSGGTARLQATSALVDQVVPDLLSRHAGLDIKRLGTADEGSQAFASLAYTLPIALLVMYILIALQFRSYVQPLIILTSVPVAAAGSVFAHLLLGYDINLASIFGMIAVVGVGINDTLLLLDRYNNLRAGGSVPSIAAISGAVRDRFRPIVITTLTTILGLLPALYMSSELTLNNILPIVVSIIGGLVFVGAGILFVVPAIMLISERLASVFTGSTEPA